MKLVGIVRIIIYNTQNSYTVEMFIRFIFVSRISIVSQQNFAFISLRD